jgi:hypothetical protein
VLSDSEAIYRAVGRLRLLAEGMIDHPAIGNYP